MKFGVPVFVFSSLVMVSSIAFADVLLIDSVSEVPVNSEEGILRPTRGVTMERVKQKYGEPSMAHPWVGDPPITRWEYPDYSVFFEYRHVLTSVVHQRR